jgi:hypothetical protein
LQVQIYGDYVFIEFSTLALYNAETGSLVASLPLQHGVSGLIAEEGIVISQNTAYMLSVLRPKK